MTVQNSDRAVKARSHRDRRCKSNPLVARWCEIKVRADAVLEIKVKLLDEYRNAGVALVQRVMMMVEPSCQA